MRPILFLILLPILFSCGETQFAKRKYTKGVYVEKRGHFKNEHSKSKKEKFKYSSKKGQKLNEIVKNDKKREENDQLPSFTINTDKQIYDEVSVGNNDPEIENKEAIVINQPEPDQLADGEYLYKDNKKKKLEVQMKIWSFVSIISAVLMAIASFILIFVFQGNPSFLIFLVFYLPIPTGVTGAVLSSRFKKYYDKGKGNLYFLLALLGIAVSVILAIVVFLLFL